MPRDWFRTITGLDQVSIAQLASLMKLDAALVVSMRRFGHEDYAEVDQAHPKYLGGEELGRQADQRCQRCWFGENLS